MKKLIVALGLLAGCSDPGAEPLEACRKAASAGNIGPAIERCESASQKAAWWGGTKKEAEAKLAELKPQLEAWKKAQAERKAAEQAQAMERARGQLAAQAAALAEAKRVVVGKYFGSRGRRDGSCTGKGLPPYKFEFEGGTYEQNAMVATSAKCVALYPGSPISPNDFCCPDP